ncbi:class I SAM-dependent methyltransferase [Ekhidna sp.]|uniref:class I SAM-dependent methyltransferase n=1 Tax=Ekhidna sp. TaxID=2608089 RepID=UPI003B50BB31
MRLPFLRFRAFWPSRKTRTSDSIHFRGKRKTKEERAKSPKRTEVINYLISYLKRDVSYLEIGVRNPHENFNDIVASTKYSVDPGLEAKVNLADFKVTSDEFFDKLGKGDVLTHDIKFDVIFVDGLHLAEQVNKDIENSIKYLAEDGFIVLHDCNPPTEWHARESYYYADTPAGGFWNGTTWKAFLRWRFNAQLQSCCIDSDWGVGILSKKHKIGNPIPETNMFYEYSLLDANRKELMNLITFDELKQKLES